MGRKKKQSFWDTFEGNIVGVGAGQTVSVGIGDVDDTTSGNFVKPKKIVQEAVPHTRLPQPITNSIEQMMIIRKLGYQFYGEFCNYINFTENNQIPTMGVNVTKRGMNWIFNREFAETLQQEECNYVVIHEILHLMYNHPQRTGEHHNHELANVAQDMIINHIIDTDFDPNFTKRPYGILKITDEYLDLIKKGKRKLYFEDLYDYLLQKKEEHEKKNGQGKPQQGNDKQGQPNQGKPQKGNTPNGDGSPTLGEIFDSLNKGKKMTLDEHLTNEIDNDLAKQIVENITDGLKARGLGVGNVESVLGKIVQKRKDYLKEIKRNISNLKGSSIYKTINRPSLLSVEGIKGKKRTGKGFNVLLDTSGSMGGDFEKILSFIFQRNILVNLVQCDVKVQKYQTLSKMKEFHNLKIKGFGGTELQPGIDFIKSKKELSGFNLVVLTDGYCDSLNFDGIKGCKRVLIISTGIKVETTGRMSIKQIVIDKNS